MTDTSPDTSVVWQTLGTILDPEFAISIVDLGLIYSVECDQGNVTVIMTLTTPTCPSGSWIQQGVEQAVRAIPGVKDARIHLVFEPQWNTEMLTAEARRQLGWGDAS
jgi:metal-sulfur cluster biosynthetic enzyme